MSGWTMVAMMPVFGRLRLVPIFVVAICSGLVLLAAGRPASAHPIPDNIIVQAMVERKGHDLQVFWHVPVGMLQAAHARVNGEPVDEDPRTPEQRLAEAIAEIAGGVQFYEDDRPLGIEGDPAGRFSAANHAFQTLDEAIETLGKPPSVRDKAADWTSGWVDLLVRYRIESETSALAMNMALGDDFGGLLRIFVRYISPSGAIRAFEFHGSSGLVTLDPGWAQAAWTFGQLGFEHILSGSDHLLFLLCLVVPFGLRHLRALAGVITAFTVAHSITLIASASGLVPAAPWFPALVEALIALSILYMALENLLVVWRGDAGQSGMLRRCMVVGAFGLVHGFGFSFILSEQLQFAGTHLLVSLVSFNLGVEAGQLAFLALVLPVLTVLMAGTGHRRIGIAIVSILIAHIAWHWLAERWFALVQAARPVVGEMGAEQPGALALLAVLIAAAGVAAVVQLRRSSTPGARVGTAAAEVSEASGRAFRGESTAVAPAAAAAPSRSRPF